MRPAPRHPPPHRRSQGSPAIAPRGPRRVSGPVSRRMVAAPAAGAALPRRGSTGLFARVRALPEHRVVDRLLRSRLWIWALGALLGGIVAMQVSLLKLNSGIARAVETTSTLERQNAGLETAIARLSAPDRINTGAQALSMVLPPAGEVGYLTAGPRDGAHAVDRMEPPSDAAKALMANGGVDPSSLAAPATTTVAPVDPATGAPVDPATGAAVDPATGAAAPAVTEPAPVAEEPPPTTEASPTGGAVAGQG
jgi:hypothetical protein